MSDKLLLAEAREQFDLHVAWAAEYQATIERQLDALGEALYLMSGPLLKSGFLNDGENHRLYENVVAAFREIGWIPDALSTPVAQGDEVRAALAEASGWMQGNHDEGCALDPEYGSGGGKCTCGLDEAMTRVNAALATLTKGARDAG